MLRDVIEHASGTVPMATAQPTLEHITALIMPLAAADNFDEDAWDQVLPSCSQRTFCTLSILSRFPPAGALLYCADWQYNTTWQQV